MGDNTQLGPGGGGDTIRTLDKTGTGIPKTEVVALDLGGGDGRSEFLGSFPLPVKLDDVPTDDDGNPLFSFSPSSMDALEMLFRQTITAIGQPYPQTLTEAANGVTPLYLFYQPLDIRRYGADLTGVRDSSQAIINALKSCPYYGGSIFCSGGGTIAVNALVQLDGYTAYNDFAIDFTGLTITTTLTSGNIFQFGDTIVKGAAQNFEWKGGFFNLTGNNVVPIAVYRCQNVKFKEVRAVNAKYSFLVDGTVAPTSRIISIKFDSCYSANATIGYFFNAQNPQLGSYTGIKMDTCASESDATGVDYEGFTGMSFATLHMDNCEVQNSSVAGVVANQCVVEINSSFCQTFNTLTVPSINAKNGAVVHVRGSVFAYPVIDATSWVLYDEGTSETLTNLASPARLSGGALGDNDAAGWGPPNYPTGKAGMQAQLGYQWRDSVGVDWVCTFAGTTSGSAPFVKFMPLNDPCEVIIPVTFSTVGNGTLLWFPQMDFIVEEVMLLVTTTATGGTSFALSAGSVNTQGLVSTDADQGAIANLTAGKLITSRRNRNSLAQLTGENTLAWVGNEYNSSSGTVGVNGLYTWVSGTFTAGAGKVIVRGYRPRVTTTGFALAGAALPAFTQSPGSNTQVLYNNAGAVAGAASLTYATATGGVTIIPASGVGLNVTAASGLNAIQCGSGGNNIGFGTNIGLSGAAENIYSQTATPLAIGTTVAQSLNLYTNGALRVSTNSSGNVTVSAPSSGAAVTLPAGTTTVEPLLLTSGTNLTTAVAGATEYDGTCKYFTPFATNRSVAMTEAIQIISAAYTLTSQTGAQKLLNATSTGAITLPVGVFEFECAFTLTSMSASSGSFGFALGGTATHTDAWWATADKPAALATASTTAGTTFNTAANTTLVAVNTNTVGLAQIRGIIRVTVTGTIIPQVSLTVAAAAIVGANSFFRILPVGPSGFTTVGQWT